jgi:hypothetical protein
MGTTYTFTMTCGLKAKLASLSFTGKYFLLVLGAVLNWYMINWNKIPNASVELL